MDDHSSPPPSPKSPFSKYLADASLTHFNSKYIDEELAKPNSTLDMVLKEVKAPNEKNTNLLHEVASRGLLCFHYPAALARHPFVRIVFVVAPGALSCWPHWRASHRPCLA
jgi:hypothetical protein